MVVTAILGVNEILKGAKKMRFSIDKENKLRWLLIIDTDKVTLPLSVLKHGQDVSCYWVKGVIS